MRNQGKKSRGMKRLLGYVSALCLLLLWVLPAAAEGRVIVADIQKYGNLVLSMTGSDFLKQGYAYGDIVTVTIAGTEYEMPVGSNYSDVDQGSMICRAVVKAETGEDQLILAINMGDLATATGIAEKEKTEADPGYIWHFRVREPVEVTFAMKEAGGYRDQIMIHQLVRSENRDSYPELTDAEYANFRMISTGRIRENTLYRSSSPVNPEINRNQEADEAAREAGIRTFINLADTAQGMKAYDGYAQSYYSTQPVICLNLGVDFNAEEFRRGLAEGLHFLAEGEAPFLVHCNEGKDRAGFVSAVLEALMGATAEEITADYMKTFYNYYGVEPGTEQYDVIAGSNIQKSLATAFGIESIFDAELEPAAENYLMEIGLTPDEIGAIKAKLGN